MGRKTDPIIRSFSKVVLEQIRPCRIILFGSRARGNAKPDSDYDFLLISPQFRKWEWEERSSKAYHWKRNIPAAMDIICLTPQEFEWKKQRIGVIQEAAREGMEVIVS